MLRLEFDYGGLKPTVTIDCSDKEFDANLFKKYFDLEQRRQQWLFEIREPDSMFHFDYAELRAAIDDAINDMGIEKVESMDTIYINLD